MKVFLAGAETKDFHEMMAKINIRNILCSYFYINKDKGIEPIVKLYEENGFQKPSIFLDSGGFTARVKGKAIPIGQYCKFIKDNRKYIFAYANLDTAKIEETQYNQQFMEDQGLKPLPVFHVYEPPEVLEEMCKKYEYICIGGLAETIGTAKFVNRVYLNILKCLNIINKHKVRVHVFGVGSPIFIDKLKSSIYSCDTTAWMVGSKFGKVYQFDGGKLLSYSKRNFYQRFARVHELHWREISIWNLMQWRAYSNQLEEWNNG